MTKIQGNQLPRTKADETNTNELVFDRLRAIVKRKPMIKAVNFKLLMLSYIRYKVTRRLNYLVEMDNRQISFA